MDLVEYLKLQNKDFEEYGLNLDKQILVAAETVKDLEDYYKDFGATVELFKDEQSYLVCLNNGNYELFIKGSYRGYRKRFIEFLYEKYNVPRESITKEWNVDHVFNKARANDYYIRMILLNDVVNQDWGRSYERTMTERRLNSTNNRLLFLDYSVFAKVMNLPGFKIGDFKLKKYSVEEEIQLISQNANEAINRLADIYGEQALPMKEYIEQFYRSEYNQLVNNLWNDPTYISPEKIDYTVNASESGFKELLENLNLMLQDLLNDTFEIYTEGLMGNKTAYTHNSALLIENGATTADTIEDIYADFITRMGNTIEVDLSYVVPVDELQVMMIRLYDPNYVAVKYLFHFKKKED